MWTLVGLGSAKLSWYSAEIYCLPHVYGMERLPCKLPAVNASDEKVLAREQSIACYYYYLQAVCTYHNCFRLRWAPAGDVIEKFLLAPTAAALETNKMGREMQQRRSWVPFAIYVPKTATSLVALMAFCAERCCWRRWWTRNVCNSNSAAVLSVSLNLLPYWENEIKHFDCSANY